MLSQTWLRWHHIVRRAPRVIAALDASSKRFSSFDRRQHQQHNQKQQTNNSKWIVGSIGATALIAGYWTWKHRPGLSEAHMISGDPPPEEPPKANRFAGINFIADIVEQVSKSVVYIETPMRGPFGLMALSAGSGFVVDKANGVILTNAHVVGNGSTRGVTIKFNEGQSVEGTVEFVDDRLDLATVRVPPGALSKIEPIKMGDSRKSRAGEWVIAVGAPFNLSNTVTVGVISSISRTGKELGIGDHVDYIQTDASINVGNSGGPLLNVNGEAIGINTLKVGEGISFAIPAEYAKEFLRIATERRLGNGKSWWGGLSGQQQQQRPLDPYGSSENVPVPSRKKYLGVSLITLTPQLIEGYRAQGHQLPDVKNGVLVYRVVLGSPAHQNGLEAGDIIQSINGTPIIQASDVYKIIDKSNDLTIRIMRGNEQFVIRVNPQIVE